MSRCPYPQRYRSSDVQDTAARLLPAEALGLGVGWIFHDVPSHASAKVTWSPEELASVPTARQASAEVQDTRDRLPPLEPLGFGVVWTCHSVPSHTSASVPVAEEPTAVQASASVHDTAVRLVVAEPSGLGVVWTVQEVPSQASANVTWPPDESV
jgi:hypothetical protein